LETIVWVKILKFIDADPGSGMETIRIRDPGSRIEKIRTWDPGSGIRDKHPGSATLVFSFTKISESKNIQDRIHSFSGNFHFLRCPELFILYPDVFN
jgi:hypothetical protein